MAEDKVKYHNFSFGYEFLPKLKGSLYAFQMTEENGMVTLLVVSTSLSELDDEQVINEEFFYPNRDQAAEDLQQATIEYQIEFEAI